MSVGWVAGTVTELRLEAAAVAEAERPVDKVAVDKVADTGSACLFGWANFGTSWSNLDLVGDG